LPSTGFGGLAPNDLPLEVVTLLFLSGSRFLVSLRRKP
jgi:hypothetical protein